MLRLLLPAFALVLAPLLVHGQTPTSIEALRLVMLRQVNASTTRANGAVLSLRVTFDTPPSATTAVEMVVNPNYAENITRIDERTYLGGVSASSLDDLIRLYNDGSYELRVRETKTGATTRVFLPIKFSTFTDPQPVLAADFDDLQKPDTRYSLRWPALPDATAGDIFGFRVDDHLAQPVLLSDLPLAGDHLDFTLPGSDYAYSYVTRAHARQGLADNGVTKLTTGIGYRTILPLRLGVDAPRFTGSVHDVSATPGAVPRLLGPLLAGSTVEVDFQWKKDGQPVPGANQWYLDLPAASLADAGLYTLEATNYKGTARSKGLYLTIDGILTPAHRLPLRGLDPHGVCVGRDGAFYSVDDSAITRLDRDGNLTVFAGDYGTTGLVDGPAARARFNFPFGIAADAHGNLFIADTYNHRIRKITPTGEVSTFLGQPASAAAQDLLSYPMSLAFDPAGNLFVLDAGNFVIRKITPDGHMTIHAGAFGRQGYQDGPAATARFDGLQGLAIDRDGYLYVGEFSRNTIRVVAPDGSVRTLAGQPPPGTADPRLSSINNLALTLDGTLFVALTGGIVTVSPGGEITPRLISPAAGRYPKGVTTDTDGQVYVQDLTAVWQAVLTPGLPQPALARPLRSIGSPTGATAVLNAEATGPNLFYRWFKDGVRLPAATGPRLILPNFQPADAGTYLVEIGNANGRLTATARVTAETSSRRSRIINLSVRSRAGLDTETLIAGFVVGGGDGRLPVLARCAGPGLRDLGVANTLGDPSLSLTPLGRATLATNDNWGGDATLAAAARRVGAFAFAPQSLDSALLPSLPADAYTVQVPAHPAPGVALVEIYDAAADATAPHLVNVSARALVGAGDDVLIAGFVVDGPTSKTVLIRGLGPRLRAYGLSDALADPLLELHHGADTAALNDEWGGAADLAATSATVGAVPLEDSTSSDAALLLTLAPGVYSALLRGAQDETGIGLIEVYEVP